LLELTEDISFALEYLELEKERIVIEDRYKNIVEKAPIGIFTQLSDVITYINPEGYKMLGALTYKEIVGKNIIEIIHPDYLDIVLKRKKMLENGESTSELEEKFNKTDGTEINVMVSAIPYSQNGQKGAQVFFRDLTEQIKTRKEIDETNERFRLITKATNDALWDWDLVNDEIWWNEGFKDLFGYKEDEIEKGSDSFMNKIHENDKQRIVSGIELAISSGLDFWFDEYSFRKKDGTYAYVFDRGYIIKNSDNKPYRMVGSMIDITYRRQMEEDLKLSEEKWRSLFENSPSIIFTINNNYIITGINRSINRIFNNIDFLGKNCFELFHKDEKARVNKILDETIIAKEAVSFTVKSAEINNKQSYFTVQVIPQIKNSEVEGLTLIATDITEKKLSEEKIKETNESLHALAAHLQTIREEERSLISREIHDQLGQELTALKMDIAFLSKRIEKAKTVPDWDEINNGLRSMSEITDQTINSVRRIARDLRPDILDKLGLREAIEWQAEEFTKRTGIDCIVSVTSGELDFDIDLNTTVFRIIQESLTNVARHSGATRSKIGLSIQEKSLYLTIEDNGRGISDEEIENTKSLGLVGIKERAYSVGGNFTITGQKDEGTLLKIIIPLTI
jgi:PAS domain S-box-containing protein